MEIFTLTKSSLIRKSLEVPGLKPNDRSTLVRVESASTA